MGPEEMKEIAAIISFILKNAKPAIITKGEKAGQQNKSKAEVPEEVRTQAKERVNKLLSRHVLYPQLDLAFLEENFNIQ